MTGLDLPGNGPVILRNLRVPVSLTEGFPLRDHDAASGLATADIGIRDGRFVPAASLGPCPGLDAGGRLMLPGFVDMHVHLDKAFTAHRTGFSDNGLSRAVELSLADAPNRTVDDLIARMDAALRRADANGTVAMRTHLDTFDTPARSAAWTAFTEIEAAWKDRIALQAVALMALFRVEQEDFDDRCADIARRGGILGAFIGPGAATPERLDRLVLAAARHGLDLDLHVDETLDAAADGLALLTDAVLRHRFGGRVVAGHCCALAQKPEGERDRLIGRMAEAGIHVVSLPLTNGFLQDRAPGRTPLRRGMAPVHELAAAGVGIAFASDNVRDAFYPYGDFDMLAVVRQAHFLAQLEAEPARWAPAAHRDAARAMRLDDAGTLAAGHAADAVIFEAYDWADLLGGSATGRTILRRGRTQLPLHDDSRAETPATNLKWKSA
ncbi:amidohydrolase family protein [Rhizobiaceae bacterium BDR2-2]|uniref:Amidohydrolase family protein n=1 Tax=Ectorhizobium quercum TaxID=2965071 RepID=A0AAE3N1T6_9HYPH|nr:amidohydrolase family protein [Ectorhizobium quercum]MCX8998386.1 amidohydrolase family protein [Ectorhizobium quercum]